MMRISFPGRSAGGNIWHRPPSSILEGNATRKSPDVRGASKLTIGTFAKAEIEHFNSGE
jgi:hypothetical protein